MKTPLYILTFFVIAVASKSSKGDDYSTALPDLTLQPPRVLMSTSLMAEDLVPVGLQKQLLVDDYVIAEKHNITRVLGKVKKVGIVSKPTLESDFHPKWTKPDGSRVGLDYGYYTSVAYNDKEKTFQMWYMGGVQGRFHSPKAGTGYAESKDGLTWTKPSIREDHKDNVVHLSQGYSCSVDPTLAWGHPEKYKAAFDDNMDRPCQAGIAYSADGISWTAYNKGKPVTHRAADTQNQIMWDSIAKRYCLLTRTDLGGVGGSSESRSQRIMVHTKNNDLINHPTAWKTIADKIKVDDPKQEKNQWGKPLLQFNSMTLWIHEGVYFGLMDVYTVGKPGMFDGFEYEKKHDHDFMDFYIGTSRDCVNFDKSWVHNRKPLVPRGPAGSFDKDGIKPPAQILTLNDEHWIYYGGMNERHYSRGRHLNIGLAKLPLDRFIGQAASAKEGIIITKPFTLEGDTLEVNVDAKSGWVKVELLDAAGDVISGKRTTHVDELRLTPKLKLQKHKGKTVKLKFTLQNAKLYAFQFKN